MHAVKEFLMEMVRRYGEIVGMDCRTNWYY